MCTLQCNTTADQAVDGDIEISSLQYHRAQTWRFVAEKLCVCNDDAVKKKTNKNTDETSHVNTDVDGSAGVSTIRRGASND